MMDRMGISVGDDVVIVVVVVAVAVAVAVVAAVDRIRVLLV